MSDTSTDSTKVMIFSAMKRELSKAKLDIETRNLIAQGRIPECVERKIGVQRYCLMIFSVLLLYIIYSIFLETIEEDWWKAIAITTLIGLMGLLSNLGQAKLTRMQVLLELWDHYLLTVEENTES